MKICVYGASGDELDPHYFEAAEAMGSLQNAYALSPDRQLLEKMYVLNRLLGREGMPDGLEKAVDADTLQQFKSNLESRKNLAQYQGKALEAASLQEEPEPARTESYLELLYRWKEEYRKNRIS